MPLKYIHFWSEDNAHAEINLAVVHAAHAFAFAFPKTGIMNIIYRGSSPNFAANIKQI